MLFCFVIVLCFIFCTIFFLSPTLFSDRTVPSNCANLTFTPGSLTGYLFPNWFIMKPFFCNWKFYQNLMALNKYKKKIVSKLRILISGRLHSSFYQTLLTSLSFYKDSFAMYETIIFLMICLWPKSNAPVGSKDECDFFRRAQFVSPIPLFCLSVNPFSLANWFLVMK